jgi:hypothetical protein
MMAGSPRGGRIGRGRAGNWARHNRPTQPDARLFQRHQPLETADADTWLSRVSTAERVGGFVAAPQRSPVSTTLKVWSVDAQRFEHFGARISRTAPFSVSRPSPWRLHGGAAALGAQVEQAARAIAHLRKQKAAPVAQLGL